MFNFGKNAVMVAVVVIVVVFGAAVCYGVYSTYKENKKLNDAISKAEQYEVVLDLKLDQITNDSLKTTLDELKSNLSQIDQRSEDVIAAFKRELENAQSQQLPQPSGGESSPADPLSRPSQNPATETTALSDAGYARSVIGVMWYGFCKEFPDSSDCRERNLGKEQRVHAESSP